MFLADGLLRADALLLSRSTVANQAFAGSAGLNDAVSEVCLRGLLIGVLRQIQSEVLLNPANQLEGNCGKTNGWGCAALERCP